MDSQSSTQPPPLELPAPEAGKDGHGRIALKILAVAWVWLVLAGALITLAGREPASVAEAPAPVAVPITAAPLMASAAPIAPPAPRTVVEILPPSPHAGGNSLFGGAPALAEPIANDEPVEPAAPAERPQFISGLVPRAPIAVAAPPPPAETVAPVQAAPPPREETARIALVPAIEPRARPEPARPEPRVATVVAPAAPRQVAAVPPRPAAAVRGGGAWQQYRRPFNLADARPRIAIVIGELGVGAAATEQALAQLPGGVTLLFNSATPLPVLQDLIVRARALGHEVLITLPLNPEAVPVASLSEAQDVAGYAGNLLDRLGGAAGVVPSQIVGLAGAAALRATLGHAQRRGMMLVSRGGGPVLDTARQMQLPRLSLEGAIDDQPGRASIDARLATLERRARETGIALAYGRPYAVTMQRLDAWIQTLEARGFALAPTTALVPRYRDR